MTEKRDVLIGLVMFALNFLIAVWQKWTATDLVWGLWVSSLTLGYAYILTSIFGMLFHGQTASMLGGKGCNKGSQTPPAIANVIFVVILVLVTGFSYITLIFILFVAISVLLSLDRERKERMGLGFLPDRQHAVVRLMTNLPPVLFFLGFFSFHFIFFHFIHSIFLNGFFPILAESPFGQSMDETVVYFFDLIKISVRQLWLFVLVSGLSRLNLYVKAFRGEGENTLFLPYKNVVRMHITIFVVAFLSMAKLHHYVLYFVFIIYFLPVGSIIKWIDASRKSKKNPNTDPSASGPIE